jgi:hypothetical protein
MRIYRRLPEELRTLIEMLGIGGISLVLVYLGILK